MCSWLISTASAPVSADRSLNAPGSTTSTPFPSMRRQECVNLVMRTGLLRRRFVTTSPAVCRNRESCAARPRWHADTGMGETMRAQSRRTLLLTSSALVAGVLLAGCSGGDSSDSSAPSGNAAGLSDEAAPAAGLPDKGAPAAAPEGKAPDSPAQAPDLGVDQRSIVYRGSISVRVENVTAAASQAAGIASTAGGFVGSDNRSSGTGSDQASMELRVPADKFASVVDQLSKLGTEQMRQISTEDVTEQTVDLDARITVQQARVDSGRRLLSQAKSLSDLVMLEREVATRESDLASLQAKKRHLADLTALSTITVTLLDPQAAVVKGPDDGPPGFLSGLAAGWHALLASLAVLLTVLGAVLPWAIAFGLPIWGIVYVVRRFIETRRAGHPAALAPAGPPLSRLRPGTTPAGTTPAGTTPASTTPAGTNPAGTNPAGTHP